MNFLSFLLAFALASTPAFSDVLVNGQLKNATPEKVTSDPVTNVVEGRFVYNTVSHVNKFYDGTAWRTNPTTASKLSTFAATSSSELAGVISDETGSGALAFATSPTFVTPTLGAATATSVNKVAITAPASSATLTIADGKTLTASNTLTFTGTDSSSVAFGSGGTATYTSNTLAVFAATTSLQLLGVLSDETGTGAAVFANTPTLVTPVLGAATATSINKVAITAPATSATLTVADGKTLTATNSVALVGTDGSTLTYGTGGTIAYIANKLSVFAATSSSELAGVLSNETGSGLVVFNTAPTFATSILLQNAAGSQPTLGLSEDPDNGTDKVVFQAPATLAADYTLTWPVDDGNSGQVLSTNGTGTLTWASPFTNPMSTTGALPYSSDGSGTPASLVIGTAGKRLKSVSGLPAWGWTSINSVSADYTILDTDGYDSIFVTTGSSTRTVTLPAAANNVGRAITIKKVDSGTGKITLARAGSDTIDGSTGFSIGVGALNQYHFITLVSDGTNWYVTSENHSTQWLAFTPTGSWSTNTTYTGFMKREGDALRVQVKIALAGAPTTATLTVNVPASLTIDTAKLVGQGSAQSPFGQVTFLRSGTNTFVGFVGYSSSTVVAVNYIDDGTNAVFYAGMTQAAPHTWANNDTIYMEFLIPIAEFAGR